MDDITYIGFHGTKKENVKLICENNFKINNDIKNNLFLGAGIYFFFIYDDAIDWNVKELKRILQRVPKYDELKEQTGVVKADIICKEDEVLDLDCKEMLYKFEMLLKKCQGKLITKREYINAKNKTAAVINMLYSRKLIKRNVILKTFIETIRTNDDLSGLKNYPRKMICVKNNSFVHNIEEYGELTDEKYESIIYFY